MTTLMQAIRDWRARRQHRRLIAELERKQRKAANVRAILAHADVIERQVDRRLRIEQKRRDRARARR